MGILIGISIISFMEIMDLFFKLILVIFTTQAKVTSTVSLGDINISHRENQAQDDNVDDDDTDADDISDIFDADDANEYGNDNNDCNIVYFNSEDEYVYLDAINGKRIYKAYGHEYVYFNNDNDGQYGNLF